MTLRERLGLPVPPKPEPEKPKPAPTTPEWIKRGRLARDMTGGIR